MKGSYLRVRSCSKRRGTLCRILSTRNTNNRTLQLVKFNLPKMTRKRRNKILGAILVETGAVALIEFISPRGIIRTPKRDFYSILVFDAKQF